MADIYFSYWMNNQLLIIPAKPVILTCIIIRFGRFLHTTYACLSYLQGLDFSMGQLFFWEFIYHNTIKRRFSEPE